jgi:hypothetical protein
MFRFRFFAIMSRIKRGSLCFRFCPERPRQGVSAMSSASGLSVFLSLAYAFCLATVSLPGEEPTPVHKDDGRSWGGPVYGQAISISTEKPAYPPSERIVLNICLKNTGAVPVRFPTGDPLLEYRIKVLLPNGKEAPTTLRGRQRFSIGTGGSGSSVLRPGRSREMRIDLTRLFDFSLPGTYTISVERTLLGPVSVEAPPRVAKSNQIKVVVDERLGNPESERDPEHRSSKRDTTR